MEQVYVPDVIAIGSIYPEWLGYGAGVTNYLAVPDMPLDAKGTAFDLPGGTIFDGDLSTLRTIPNFEDPYFRDNVAECIAHAWYDGDWTRHPWEEETVPKYTEFQDQGKYSWVKAPRFQGKPMQVGPLAQMLVGYAGGHKTIKPEVDAALAAASSLAGVKLGPEVLHSTLGRHLARALRAKVIAELGLEHWQLLAENIGKGDFTTYVKPEFPKGEQRGFGFHEAPRGTLSHWVVIRDGKIANYQAVVPSTWNAGPRDDKGQPGPYESSLIGNPVADAEHPAGGGAHHPLLRSLPRLRGAHPRRDGTGGVAGEGIVSLPPAGREGKRTPGTPRTSRTAPLCVPGPWCPWCPYKRAGVVRAGAAASARASHRHSSHSIHSAIPSPVTADRRIARGSGITLARFSSSASMSKDR